MEKLRGIEWPLVASILAATILAAPLWCVTIPGMPDYPAHYASFALIGGAPSRYYDVVWSFVPNLAAETLVPWLAHLVPLTAAIRLFLSVTVLLWAIGPALIQRALFGRANAGAMAGALFAYNANLMWGFLNYTFATGLALILLALWIARGPHRSPRRLAAFAVAFTLLYFCHLFAFAVLILAIACIETGDWWRTPERRWSDLARRALTVAGLALPAALAFLILKPAGAGESHVAFDYADSMLDRAGAALQFGFDNPVYALTAILGLAVIAGLLTKRAYLHPRMRLTILVFAVAAIAAPEWAFGGWGVHMRLPPVLGVLAFAALEWRLPARVLATAAAVLLATSAAAAVTTEQAWSHYDTQYAEFRSHIGEIRTGARILTVLDGDSLGWDSDQPYWHMAEFAIPPRDTFTPLLFATRGQHVIRIRPPFDRFAAATAQQGSPPDIDELDDLAAGRIDADEDISGVFPYLLYFQCHFDQAIVIYGRGPASHVPAMLRNPRHHSFYTLYDIAPDARCGKP